MTSPYRRFAWAISLCLVALLAPAARAEVPRPNILWITCEDTSPMLGCYGDAYARTPQLDALAAAGVRYTHAFTHAGVCAPSRSGLISGMYPTTLGSHAMRSSAVLPPTLKILPQLLRDAGYYCTNNVKTDYNFAVPENAWDESTRRAHWRGRKPGQPFFSVFNFIGTHESKIRAPFETTQHDPAQAVLPPWLPDTPTVRRDWARVYDLVSELDAWVGDLLGQLAADGLAEETIVFFFSDHGVGLPRAKQWIWDAGLRVPLLIRIPKKFRDAQPENFGAPGTVTDRLVSFVDFAPTVLSLADAPIPEYQQGRAFLGRQAAEPRQYVHAVRDRMDERYDMQRAVRDARYKYFRNYQPHLPYAPWLDYMELLPTLQEWRRLETAGLLTSAASQFMAPRKPLEELYDTAVDPHELRNLAADPQHQEILQRLREEHSRWSRETHDLGLLPEQVLLDRAAGGPEYALTHGPGVAGDPLEKARAASLLVGRGAEALPEMTAALTDPDAAVRFWGCQALLDLGSAARPAAAALARLLADPAPDVRVVAAQLTVRLGDAAQAWPVLRAALDDTAKPWSRLRAANLVDQLGVAAEPLRDVMVRIAADDAIENRFPTWVMRHALQNLTKPEAKSAGVAAQSPLLDVGVARLEITPTTPIRLIGYAVREAEATEAAQPLWAKALAIGSDAQGPALLIAVDLCGIPGAMTDALAEKLAQQTGVDRARLAVCATHTHNGPVVHGILPFIFGREVPSAQQQRIEAYADELAAKLATVARQALANRRPARLEWGQGRVTFATNRRVLEQGKWKAFGVQPDGPVDHALPLLKVSEPDGALRAVWLNYACHCTTVNADDNRLHGDWAGAAAALLEAAHPGATALISIGCGADSNPSPRGKPEFVAQHGRAIAAEAARVMAGPLTPLAAPPTCRHVRFTLPLGAVPPRQEWEAKAAGRGRDAFYARHVVDQLNRGEPLATTVPYSAQTWTFDDDLAIVFLPGEVTVDYALRLKTQFDRRRLWINAYANDAPCYIPSRRLILEGGYEVDGSMSSYDRAARLAPETEDVIVEKVAALLPPAFAAQVAQKTVAAPTDETPATGDDEAFPGPVAADGALKTITVRPDMQVELVAAEPLVADPVNIAWGADGKLWVVEMADYPNGIDGSAVEGGGKPGGRVKFLVDDDGDGRYDRATLFADELNFPTAVTPFRNGVLVTAAPHLLFLVDTDGDGRADKREVLLEGFGEGNQQHRVNGLAWGLDNWLYLANGDSDGKIRSVKTGQVVDIQGRDLRYNPWTGEIDAETGRAQYGRCRDDAGNWFGCNNSNPAWHYVLSDRYVRRNPYYAPPKLTHPISENPGAAEVFPTSRTLTRFNDFDKANRFTSACGLTIYRDDFLGAGFRGNTFVCEPVHNLVHREIVEPDGVTFKSRRAPDEQTSEFFASSDSWCRPVAAHTGPDGALYIVDMYRLVIEHPKWIPEEWQKKLDLRAGHDKGRIYRVFPTGKKPRAIPKLDSLTIKELVEALDTPNGWQRDTTQRLIIERNDREVAIPFLTARLNSFRHHTYLNLHLISMLEQFGQLEVAIPEGGSVGVDIAEARLILASSQMQSFQLARNFSGGEGPYLPLALQAACTLGEFSNDRVGRELMRLLLQNPHNEFIVAAVFSSLNAKNIGPALDSLLDNGAPKVGVERLFSQVLGIAALMPDAAVVERVTKILHDERGPIAAWRMTALAEVLDAQARRKSASASAAVIPPAVIERLCDHARALVANEKADVAERAIAARLLGRQSQHRAADLQSLGKLLQPTNAPEMQEAAVAALAKLGDEATPSLVLPRWPQAGPRLRGQLLDLLLARTPWTAELLQAVEAGSVQAAHFDAVRRQRLTTYKDKTLRAQAVKLLGASGDGDRKAVVEQFADVLKLTGDLARGRETFRKKCAVCHKLEGHGNDVGADLAALKDKSPPALLTAMLDPNRAVEDKFVGYLVVTIDGLTLVGMIGEESGTAITLRLADGKTATVLRGDIEELQSTGKSHMPEGLEKDVSRQDLADLIEYVRGAGKK